MAEFFDDRVTVTVTTTPKGASDVLDGIEAIARNIANPERTWVTVAPVEKPDSMQSKKDQSNPNEDGRA